MKRLISCLFIAALFSAGSLAAAVATGSKAPDFNLPDTSGKVHSLSDYKGKVVILEWTNHDCPFVVKFYKEGHMQRWQREAAEKGVVWLRIISSAPGTQGYLEGPAAAELAARQNVPATTATLLDPAGMVGRMYDARTTPHMYVITAEGTLVYQGAIDSIRSRRIEDIERAENYVQLALDAVLAGRAVATTDTRPYGCTVKYAN